jgi:hypothetical protein
MEDLTWYIGGKQRKGGKGKVQRKRQSSPQINDDSDDDADYVYVLLLWIYIAFTNQSQPLKYKLRCRRITELQCGKCGQPKHTSAVFDYPKVKSSYVRT